jgi:hypothetical protein
MVFSSAGILGRGVHGVFFFDIANITLLLVVEDEG